MSFLDGVGLVAQVFMFAGLLAFIVERLVEKFAKPPLKRFGYGEATPYVALLLGGLFSAAFGIDLLTPLAEAVGLQPFVPWIGYLLTGLMVGGGSNFLHDVWPGGDGDNTMTVTTGTS